MSRNNNHMLADLSDSDFLSFLYSERERENSLSQYQGWNNWALAGAIVTIVCSGYVLLKNNPLLEVINVLYDTCSLIAFFLSYHTWASFFRRKRAVDFSKVRLMKEVMPVVKIVFVYICSIVFSIMIVILDGFNVVFWLWIFIIFAYTVALILGLCNKEKVVPTFFEEMFLPWVWVNAAFDTIMGVVFSIIGTQSYEFAEKQFLTPEFEFAACVAAFFVLLFILFKLNFGNKVVMRFDEIIDMYLYAGATKDDTFHKISKNRMGYGVLEACSKEMSQIKELMDSFKADEQKIDAVIASIENDNCVKSTLKSLKAQTKVACRHRDEILTLSKKLLEKTDAILKVVPYMTNIPDFQRIIEENKLILTLVNGLNRKINHAISLIEQKLEVIQKESA